MHCVTHFGKWLDQHFHLVMLKNCCSAILVRQFVVLMLVICELMLNAEFIICFYSQVT